MSFSVGGIFSGLDTDSIVEALVGVKEATLITPLEDRIVNLTARQSALSEISDAMKTMLSAASSLQDLTDFEGRTGVSSDSTTLSLTTVGDDASKGSYSVYVNQLAQADRNYFEGVANTNATTFGTGDITISSSGESVVITIDSSNNTLAGIRDAINSSGGPVTASIVNDGSGASPYRLVLTSNETGDDADITHDIASVLSLTNDAALNADSSNTAQDAQVTINGLAIYSESNTFVDAIDDVTFEISQVETDTPLTLTISDDFTTPISTISSFIASYNLVLAEFSAAFDTDDTTGASTGTLSSDISVQIAQNRLASIMTNVHYELAGNAFQSLAEIGITMNDDGLLDVDTDVLEDALTEDADSVKRLFQGMSSSVDGIADQAYDVLYDLTNSADGVFTRKSRIWDETIDDLLDLMEEREDRIETYEELVRSKFNYLEELLSTLEAQSSALEGLQSVLDSSNS